MRFLPAMFFVFIISILLWGCFKGEKETNAYELREDPQSNLVFLLDSTTPNYTIPDGCDYAEIDQKRILVYYNRLTYSLSFYDIQTKKLHHRINLKKQGIYSVKHILGIHVINKDSILLSPAYIKRLYLSNWQGSICQVFNLMADAQVASLWKNEPYTQIDFFGDECIMQTAPLGNQNRPGTYYTIPLGASYNLKSKKIAINYIKFPELYQNKINFGFYHGGNWQCINKRGEIIMSFPIDPKVYIYSKEKKLKKTALAQSHNLSGQLPKPFSHPGEEEKYYYNNDAYEGITYDRYRNIYYRFATKGVDGNPPSNATMISKGLFKPLFVVILDHNFKKLSEVELPANKHYFLNRFVAKEGLYISNSHPDNPAMQENKLSFTCYKLVNNE